MRINSGRPDKDDDDDDDWFVATDVMSEDFRRCLCCDFGGKNSDDVGGVDVLCHVLIVHVISSGRLSISSSRCKFVIICSSTSSSCFDNNDDIASQRRILWEGKKREVEKVSFMWASF